MVSQEPKASPGISNYHETRPQNTHVTEMASICGVDYYSGVKTTDQEVSFTFTCIHTLPQFAKQSETHLYKSLNPITSCGSRLPHNAKHSAASQ